MDTKDAELGMFINRFYIQSAGDHYLSKLAKPLSPKAVQKGAFPETAILSNFIIIAITCKWINKWIWLHYISLILNK